MMYKFAAMAALAAAAAASDRRGYGQTTRYGARPTASRYGSRAGPSSYGNSSSGNSFAANFGQSKAGRLYWRQS